MWKSIAVIYLFIPPLFPDVSYPMPTVLKMAAPFTLSSAVRMLLEVTPRLSLEEVEAGGEEARRMEALAHLKVGLQNVYIYLGKKIFFFDVLFMFLVNCCRCCCFC